VKRAQEKTFSDEKRLQLMQEIAQEFSVRFDPKDIHRRLSNPAEANYVSIWKVLIVINLSVSPISTIIKLCLGFGWSPGLRFLYMNQYE
jgi:hypothetical protein